MYWRFQERSFTPDGRSEWKSFVGFLIRRTAWRASPGNETGMYKTHMVGGYLSSDRVGIYDWQELPQPDGGVVPNQQNYYSILIQFLNDYL
jgi:hypothetical protein